MAKRAKRLERGIESIKKEIEEHFIKIERDVEEDNKELERYHAKEIDKSLIGTLEHKIKLLGIKDNSIKIYRERLNELRKKLKL